MKLSDQEIEMISNIPERRRHRKSGTLIAFATALAALVVAVLYFGFHNEPFVSFMVYFVCFSLGGVVNVYFGVGPEDRLIDLLQRYVNNDPEAIRQFSLKAESSKKAA